MFGKIEKPLVKPSLILSVSKVKIPSIILPKDLKPSQALLNKIPITSEMMLVADLPQA